MKCLSPITVHGNEFNCGRCHACRINYTSSWTLRMLYELANWDSASFVTLTYDDEHLPKDRGLHPEHLKKFWKDIRYDLGKERHIKYYACGEYGDKTKRPHYHAIIYGLNPFEDKDRKLISDNWTLCDPFLFDKNRKEQTIAYVCREDIAYVAGYVQKKLNGDMAVEEYGDKVRPFSRCSQGLGLDFAMMNADRLINNGYTFLNGHKIGVPRYFREKLGISQREIAQSVNTKNFLEDTNALIDTFQREMVRKGMWCPEHPETMARRFERWLNDFNFSLARQAERDFHQKQRMISKL